MRGCTCRGLTLCDQCQRLAERAGVLQPPEVPPVSEKAFMQAVRKIAEAHAWETMHIYDSRKSAGVGWPDLVLARPPDLLFVECKTDTGVLTIQQEHWLDVLRRVEHTETFLWTPSRMAAIIARLTR